MKADPAARDKLGGTSLDCALKVNQRAVQDLINSRVVTMAEERNMETVCKLCRLASTGEVETMKVSDTCRCSVPSCALIRVQTRSCSQQRGRGNGRL